MVLLFTKIWVILFLLNCLDTKTVLPYFKPCCEQKSKNSLSSLINLEITYDFPSSVFDNAIEVSVVVILPSALGIGSP